MGTDPAQPPGGEPDLDDLDTETVEDLDVDEEAEDVKGGPYMTDPTCHTCCTPCRQH